MEPSAELPKTGLELTTTRAQQMIKGAETSLCHSLIRALDAGLENWFGLQRETLPRLPP